MLRRTLPDKINREFRARFEHAGKTGAPCEEILAVFEAAAKQWAPVLPSIHHAKKTKTSLCQMLLGII
jgi:hypothetical protein